MKKILAWILSLALTVSLAVPAAAAEQSSFVLTAVNANSVIIEPVRISYTAGQTVKEALLATEHSFVGLEQGFIYEIDGVSANFNIFYDRNGYALDAPASEIRALCLGVSSQYSEELLDLIVAMADYREKGNVQQYPAAQEAYKAGLAAIRNGDALTAKAVLEQLDQAVSDYESIFSGTQYTVTVSVTQGDKRLTAPVVTMTDIYGNDTTVTGNSIQLVEGEYGFSISDGAYNRTEGRITVAGDMTLTAELPHGEWFGDVKILDSNKQPYPYTQDAAAHTAVFQIPDVAKEVGSLYLNVGQGDVPDRQTTKLRTIYTGTTGSDYSEVSRSWESIETALLYLLKQDMNGADFRLEAQYADSNGHTQIQSYQMKLERTPTLAALKVAAEGTVLPVAFDPVTYSYEVVTVSDELEIDAEPFGAGYEISGTGKVAASGSHQIAVTAGGKNTVYTLNITKKDSVTVKLTIPEGVDVQVENGAGSIIAPVEGAYHLIPGERYTYRATKDTHYHTVRTFTASEGLNITVAVPTTTDWLTDLAVYNGSNAATRVEYPSDRDFTASDHDYVFRVSDCNTTVYMQATSGYTVTALYTTQTTAAATHGKIKEVAVDKQVSASGSAKILSQVVARSGYSNTVTLRVSRTAGDVTYYQDYTLTLARQTHLTAFGVSDQEGSLVLLDNAGKESSFDRDVTQYTVSVNRDETVLYLSADFPNMSDSTDCCGGYFADVNGIRYDALEDVSIGLVPELPQETVTVEVCHTDGNAVRTRYVLTVRKTDPVHVTFATTPGDAIVYLTNDLNGRRMADKEGVYSLTPGTRYSYTVTRTGYQGISGSFIAPETGDTVSITLTKAPENTKLQQLSSYWPHLRQNSDNNGVIDARTPVEDGEAVLYWATKIGDGYDKNACGCPILVDGYLYTYAGSTLYKVDTVSGSIVATAQMDRASSFAINPPTYADGMIFIGLADGTVQAFNAATLESLWIYRDPLGGQPNCSIVYHNGYVYTGFWVGEVSNANYVCISATDEDPENPKEEKLATWKYTSLGGFYWAGAFVCDDYLLIGTDDGASGYTSGKARLLSFDPLTGELLDQWKMDVVGDIRSSITAYDGKYYFTNKGGYFFEASVSGDGKIEAIRALKLYNYASNDNAPPMSTCTPTIYNGRAYVGVSGTNQFGAYSGHNITVIDIPNWEIAYSVRTQGYPQTSGVLTTAYEQETGCVYVYFFDNYTPGKLRVLKDKPGQTSASMVSTETYTDKGSTKTYQTAYALFTPDGDQAQYAICSPIVDQNGTIYFKNDSAYLMAVGSTVEKLEVTRQPDKMTYQLGETFDATGMQVTAHYSNGLSRDVTGYVSWSQEALTEQDTDFVITLPYMMYQNQNGAAGVDYPAPFAAIQLNIQIPVTLGDVTGDAVIDLTDVSEIVRFINGGAAFTKGQQKAADVSGDGCINMKDVSLLLQYVSGMITEFPAASQE